MEMYYCIMLNCNYGERVRIIWTNGVYEISFYIGGYKYIAAQYFCIISQCDIFYVLHFCINGRFL